MNNQITNSMLNLAGLVALGGTATVNFMTYGGTINETFVIVAALSLVNAIVAVSSGRVAGVAAWVLFAVSLGLSTANINFGYKGVKAAAALSIEKVSVHNKKLKDNFAADLLAVARARKPLQSAYELSKKNAIWECTPKKAGGSYRFGGAGPKCTKAEAQRNTSIKALREASRVVKAPEFTAVPEKAGDMSVLAAVAILEMAAMLCFMVAGKNKTTPPPAPLKGEEGFKDYVLVVYHRGLDRRGNAPRGHAAAVARETGVRSGTLSKWVKSSR